MDSQIKRAATTWRLSRRADNERIQRILACHRPEMPPTHDTIHAREDRRYSKSHVPTHHLSPLIRSRGG